MKLSRIFPLRSPRGPTKKRGAAACGPRHLNDQGASAWPGSNVKSAANPPRRGWKPISMVASPPCCCVTITTANWCASKSAPFPRWKPFSARAAACSKIFSAAISSASEKSRHRLQPLPMKWTMRRLANQPPQHLACRAVAVAGWPAASASTPRRCCRKPPSMPRTSVVPKSIRNTCCWRWPTAM